MAKNGEKKKKRRVGLILGITIPTLLIVTPIALLYGFCYDGSGSPVKKDETFQSESLLNRVVYNSLDQAEKFKGLHVGLSESDLNQLFISAMEGLNETAKNYINAPYITIDSENRSFQLAMDANVPLFKTKIKISGSIEFVRKSKGASQDGIQLNIKDIKIARASLGDFAFNIASKFVTDEDINQIFAQAGLSLKCNLANKTMFYSARDLMNDVINKAGIDNIYTSMFDFAIEEDLLDMSYSKDCFGLKIDLAKTTKNDVLDDLNNSLFVSDKIADYVDDVELLLNSNVITTDEVDLTLNYLTHGYDDSYLALKDKDFTSIGINDNQTHKGLNIKTTTDINQVFNNEIENIDITSALTNKSLNIGFSEHDFNETLKTSNIIGQSFNFNSVDKDGKHQVNAIFIDDFYVNIASNETINFIIGVNINGLSTRLVVSSKVKTILGKKVELEIADIYYGEIKANEMMRKSCVDYVLQALSNISTWFEIKDGHLIFFDLQDCVNNMTVDPSKPETLMLKTALESASLEANLDSLKNELNIKFNLL